MPDQLRHPLRDYFRLTEQHTLPPRLADLVARFEDACARRGHTVGQEFRDDLIRSLPALRTFALSLTGDVHQADDLVQETFIRAWTKWHHFTAGTNFTAWLFTILRNLFYSQCRKAKREIEDAEGAHAATLMVPPDQEHAAGLNAVMGLIGALPREQRKALLMVGAEGFTYEETASRLGCQIGTVKSRVSRARTTLLDHLVLG